MHTGVVGTCRIRSLLARYSRSTHSSQISLLHCFQGIRMRGLTAHAGEKQVSHAPCSRNTCRIPAFRCSKRRQACTVRNAIVQSSVVNVASVENKTSENKKSRPGEKKGFVEEMRFVAMKLHTKDQAPKEGGKEASEHPMQKWQPTRQGYLNFLAESKIVYDTVESIVANSSHPEVAKFQNTGLERAENLSKDLQYFKSEYGLEPSSSDSEGPGEAYASLLKNLSETDVPAFLCHFYNIYFAHTAGGRMIGTKVASMILDNKKLEFYNYDGDYKPYLEDVRNRLNEVAEGWSREAKDHCLQETEKSFSVWQDLKFEALRYNRYFNLEYSGGLLRLVAT